MCLLWSRVHVDVLLQILTDSVVTDQVVPPAAASLHDGAPNVLRLQVLPHAHQQKRLVKMKVVGADDEALLTQKCLDTANLS